MSNREKHVSDNENEVYTTSMYTWTYWKIRINSRRFTMSTKSKSTYFFPDPPPLELYIYFLDPSMY